MDYSASINEAEDPVEASPWGNSPRSSPRHNRDELSNASSEPALFPYTTEPANGLGQAGEAEEFQRPGTATTESGTEGEAEDSATLETAASDSLAGSQHARGIPASQQARQPAGAEAHPEHGRQPQKPSHPHFRLQAKITGLERTGKKDPVLRFDVHVNTSAFHN